MPEFSTGGAFTIVAHQDDDILFMNPDLLASIEAGEANTTVYVTAGDAGGPRSYWEGRELGAKAAYSEMTGLQDWADQTIGVTVGDTTFDIVSSYLVDDPTIRLYFLRLPDGAGALAEGETQQLGRLERGDLADVTAVDGSETYTRQHLVDVLAELMVLHEPVDFRFQVHEGETALSEHVDHINTSIFSDEALELYNGGSVTVTRYVHYDSNDLPANLSAEQAARTLEIMEAYAAFDVGTADDTGALLPVYANWTQRQYIAESYELDTDTDGADAPMPDPEWPGPGSWSYSLTGPDAFLFDIGAATGAVTPKDWFVPSLDDAWDVDGDYDYAVTRVAQPADGGPAVSQDLVFDTTAEGVLTLVSATDGETTGGDGPTAEDGAGDGGTEDDGDGPSGASENNGAILGGDDTAPGESADNLSDPETSGAAVYGLGGPDGYLFVVNASTGEIMPQAWFIPSLTDAWDQDEDFVYDIVLLATPVDGGPTVEEAIRLQTVSEGVLAPVTTADEGQSGPDDGDADAAVTPGVEASDELVFRLDGADSQLFTIDASTGEIGLQTWFVPSRDDAWDIDGDHVYEIVRLSVDADDGSLSRSEALRYETLEDGAFVQLADTASPVDDALL